MPPILNAQNISKTFGVSPLFRNIAFTIGEGDRIGVIGPNGSGKSTLLQILSGTMEPDAGEVADKNVPGSAWCNRIRSLLPARRCALSSRQLCSVPPSRTTSGRRAWLRPWVAQD